MINIITSTKNTLSKFLDKFRGIFSNIQFKGFSTYISGLLLQHKRVSVDSIAALSPEMKYQDLQYFVSESNIDLNKLNTRRVDLLQKTRPTKSTRNGILVIDDTSCKKFTTKTEGAKYQYSSSEDRRDICNVDVISAYCDQIKRYPINHIPYKPADEFELGKYDLKFLTKIDMAKRLIDDAIEKSIQFSDVVFDVWYFCKELVSYIKVKNLTWIAEADANRLISYRGKWTPADKLAELIPSTKFTKKVTVTNSKGEKRTLRIYSFVSKIKNIKGHKRIVVAKGSWDATDPKEVHIFVTNHISLDPEDIVRKYRLRWGVKCLIRDMKENTGFDQYQLHYLKGISRHWHFSFIAYSFLLWAKLNGFFSRIFTRSLSTIGDVLRAFRSIYSGIHQRWIAKNKEKYHPEKTADRHILQLKMLTLSTKIDYNHRDRMSVAETSLLVRFVQNAKRDKKNQHFLRGFAPDTLWRDGSFSTVLSKTGFETSFAKLCFLESPKQSLPSSRIDFDDNLHYGSWHETNFGYAHSSLQQLFPKFVGVGKLSQTFHPERISEGIELLGVGRYHPGSRSLAQEDVYSSQVSHKFDFRSGLHCPSSIRLENSGSQSRLQSQEAPPPQLLPFDLLRRPQPRFLAWDVAPWRYTSGHRSPDALVGCSKEDTKVSLPHTHSSRFGILRPQIHRASRRRRSWLCGCGQDDLSHQDKGSESSLPQFQKRRLAGSSIYLSTLELEKIPSFYRSSPTQTRKVGSMNSN